MKNEAACEQRLWLQRIICGISVWFLTCFTPVTSINTLLAQYHPEHRNVEGPLAIFKGFPVGSKGQNLAFEGLGIINNNLQPCIKYIWLIIKNYNRCYNSILNCNLNIFANTLYNWVKKETFVCQYFVCYHSCVYFFLVFQFVCFNFWLPWIVLVKFDWIRV